MAVTWALRGEGRSSPSCLVLLRLFHHFSFGCWCCRATVAPLATIRARNDGRRHRYANEAASSGDGDGADVTMAGLLGRAHAQGGAHGHRRTNLEGAGVGVGGSWCWVEEDERRGVLQREVCFCGLMQHVTVLWVEKGRERRWGCCFFSGFLVM